MFTILMHGGQCGHFMHYGEKIKGVAAKINDHNYLSDGLD
jgi:hypothetical protein